MLNEKNNEAEREIRVSRLLHAPVALVWKVWTDPEHIKHWWGPHGFTTTITKMDITPGGEWNLIMRGPTGAKFDNESKFTEVVKEKKLVYEHISYPKFVATVDFESKGDQTQLSWRMLFETREDFVSVVKQFKADEGMKQNVEKLEKYLTTVSI